MSKISLEAPFNGFRGKICKHTQIIYKKMRQTQFTSQICNPRTKAYSADELARQSKFAAATAAVKALTTEQKAVYAEAFAGQRKYTTMFGYCFHLEWLAFDE